MSISFNDNGNDARFNLTKCHYLLKRTLVDRYTRYYGTKDYSTVEVEWEDAIPEYSSLQTLMLTSFQECRELYQDSYVEEDFYFFTAEKLHGITLAHALVTLSELGYSELAEEGFTIHRKMMKLNRMTPPLESAKLNKNSFGINPYQDSYWKKDHFDDHGLKLAMAALELLDKIPVEDSKKVYDEQTFWGPFLR